MAEARYQNIISLCSLPIITRIDLDPQLRQSIQKIHQVIHLLLRRDVVLNIIAHRYQTPLHRHLGTEEARHLPLAESSVQRLDLRGRQSHRWLKRSSGSWI
ncbi:hypothetical protein BDR06DRAFT_127051 [Suillus hirtellus]|nr:hypothetical protein BDR06DRAFT_127051 [Suillus hirtellus]